MLFVISITIYEYYDFQLSSLDIAGFVTSNPPESSSQIHSHDGGGSQSMLVGPQSQIVIQVLGRSKNKHPSLTVWSSAARGN